MSTITDTKCPKRGFLSVSSPHGLKRANKVDSSQSMRSSPQNICLSSAGRKAAKLATGMASPKPCRKASTCSEIPVSNQKREACSTKLQTFSMVTGSASPPTQSGAPLRPVSKKHTPTREEYSSKDKVFVDSAWGRNRSPKSGRLACSCLQAATPNSSSTLQRSSPAANSATKAASAPRSSPAQPEPGLGKSLGCRGSPKISAKNSSANGKGTMNPSLKA
mmetsp:Transcript_27490/g.69597  ORF Transcript_27490/g.69597 Transcript_27490/m.69597 type:complete len:220 (-) Transcript_27490:690-1349(-)